MRGTEGVQLAGQQAKSLFPADWLVMGASFSQDHWFGQSALLIQPVIRTVQQVANAMFLEESGSDPLPCSFVGDRFSPVLAKFRDMPFFIRAGPSAALTVKALDLVDLKQGLR